MTAWACIRPGWRVSRSIGSGDGDGGDHRLEGPRTGAETEATPGSRSPIDWAQPRRRTPDRAVAVKRAPCRPRCSRSGSSQAIRTWADEPAFMVSVEPTGTVSRRPDRPLGRGHADAHVALAAVELRALARDVAQMRQHRAGRGQQSVLARGRGQLGQPGAENEAALHVARHQPVVFQGHGEPVGRGSCESGRRDQSGEGGRTGLQGAQDQSCLVENADAASVVHETILPSHSVKRKFNFPETCDPVAGGRTTAAAAAQYAGLDGHARCLVGPVKTPAGGKAMGRTLAEKVWDDHVVRRAEGEPDLLFIDLHLLHEVTSPQAFDGLRQNGRPVRRLDLTIATEDHNTPTLDIDKPIADPVSRAQLETLRKNCAEFGVRLHPLGDVEQGIVHVVGPQLGLTQPGMTVVCGDSHTSTHGAFGALAFGIGTSQVEHVLATQTLPLARPKTMAITVDGELPDGVTAKDLILAIIAKIGTGGGQGYILEYRGSAIEKLSMEARMTICNMSIEAGARAGMIAPDETTFDYLEGRAARPEGRRLGRRGRVLEDAAHRRRRRLRRRGRHRRRRAGAVRHLGHQPRPGRAALGATSPTRLRTKTLRSASPPRRPWSTWGWRPDSRCATSRSTPSS